MGASTGYITWKKYVCMKKYVERMRVKEKRQIFQIIRSHPCCDHDSFLPDFGLTAGEFCIWQVLSENMRKKNLSRRRPMEEEGE
jgi:hypothetical protein